MPAMTLRLSCKVYIISKAPCTEDSGARGWMSVKPGRPQVISFTAGLYFMVQEPRG